MSPSATVVTTVHPSDDPRIRLKTVGSLVDAGWDVTYVSPAPGPSESEGFRSIVLDGGRMARAVTAWRIMAATPSDVTVIHDPDLLPIAIGLAKRRGRRRVVFDLHEDLPSQLLTRERTPRFLRAPTAAFARKVLHLAERSMTITLAEPNYEPLFSASHPVFENLPAEGSLPPVEPGEGGIVYVGDITEARGIPMLVEAVGRLPERSLTLIGRCRPELEARLREMADERGVTLEMPGFLPYAEAWQRAAGHRVGVSPLLDRPNYRASLPTKIDEYRAVGLVVVASDLPGSAAAVEGSEAAGLYPVGDTGALAAELASALHDPDRARAAKAEAALIRETRRWDAGSFVDFYEALVTHDP